MRRGKGMFEIGVMLNNLERDRLKAFRVAADLGFRQVHTSALPESWLSGPQCEAYLAAARASGLTIATMFVGFDGQSYADLPAIRRTVGLVIPELREYRCRIALQYSDLARDLGVSSLAAHIGFIPHDPAHADYGPLVSILQIILERCEQNGQTFHLETGQESAEVLLRFLHDVDCPNLGVNFDPANLLLYNTDEPLPALERLAAHVRGVHCKDALRPQQTGVLGKEVPIGQGDVDFPALIGRLRAIGYRGPLVIEREHGPNAVADVLAAREYLGKLVGGS